MTVWKAGMLAVCVDASSRADVAVYYGRDDYCTLVEGKVYRVLMVDAPNYGDDEPGLVVDALPKTDAAFYSEAENPWEGLHEGWGAYRFRPLNDTEADESLIARIKACRPVRDHHSVSVGGGA